MKKLDKGAPGFSGLQIPETDPFRSPEWRAICKRDADRELFQARIQARRDYSHGLKKIRGH